MNYYQVQQLQSALYLLGYNEATNIDGALGPITEAAIAEFLANHDGLPEGLSADQPEAVLAAARLAVLDDPEIMARGEELAARAAAGDSLNRNETFALQGVISLHGNSGTPIGIDGQLGPQTRGLSATFRNERSVLDNLEQQTTPLTSQQVQVLQGGINLLRPEDQQISMDGDFGQQTLTALQQVFDEHGLEITAAQTPEALQALQNLAQSESALERMNDLSSASDPNAVMTLQAGLILNGQYTRLDGANGSHTVHATGLLQNRQTETMPEAAPLEETFIAAAADNDANWAPTTDPIDAQAQENEAQAPQAPQLPETAVFGYFNDATVDPQSYANALRLSAGPDGIISLNDAALTLNALTYAVTEPGLTDEQTQQLAAVQNATGLNDIDVNDPQSLQLGLNAIAAYSVGQLPDALPSNWIDQLADVAANTVAATAEAEADLAAAANAAAADNDANWTPTLDPMDVQAEENEAQAPQAPQLPEAAVFGYFNDATVDPQSYANALRLSAGPDGIISLNDAALTLNALTYAVTEPGLTDEQTQQLAAVQNATGLNDIDVNDPQSLQLGLNAIAAYSVGQLPDALPSNWIDQLADVAANTVAATAEAEADLAAAANAAAADNDANWTPTLDPMDVQAEENDIQTLQENTASDPDITVTDNAPPVNITPEQIADAYIQYVANPSLNAYIANADDPAAAQAEAEAYRETLHAAITRYESIEITPAHTAAILESIDADPELIEFHQGRVDAYRAQGMSDTDIGLQAYYDTLVERDGYAYIDTLEGSVRNQIFQTMEDSGGHRLSHYTRDIVPGGTALATYGLVRADMLAAAERDALALESASGQEPLTDDNETDLPVSTPAPIDVGEAFALSTLSTSGDPQLTDTFSASALPDLDAERYEPYTFGHTSEEDGLSARFASSSSPLAPTSEIEVEPEQPEPENRSEAPFNMEERLTNLSNTELIGLQRVAINSAGATISVMDGALNLGPANTALEQIIDLYGRSFEPAETAEVLGIAQEIFAVAHEEMHARMVAQAEQSLANNRHFRHQFEEYGITTPEGVVEYMLTAEGRQQADIDSNGFTRSDLQQFWNPLLDMHHSINEAWGQLHGEMDSHGLIARPDTHQEEPATPTAPSAHQAFAPM